MNDYFDILLIKDNKVITEYQSITPFALFVQFFYLCIKKDNRSGLTQYSNNVLTLIHTLFFLTKCTIFSWTETCCFGEEETYNFSQ